LAAGTIEEIAATYQSFGWTADDAAIRALASTKKPEDMEAVKIAVRAVYLPGPKNQPDIFKGLLRSQVIPESINQQGNQDLIAHLKMDLAYSL